MIKKTIKELCKEKNLDEETAYAICCSIKREFLKMPSFDINYTWSAGESFREQAIIGTYDLKTLSLRSIFRAIFQLKV